MNESNLEEKQKQVCARHQASFLPCDLSLKLGVSRDVKSQLRPINGLRLKEENGTSGWYIWVGEYKESADFFVTLHGEHLAEWEEIVLPYLGLPEGWRFLIAEDYEDVWFDPTLIIP